MLVFIPISHDDVRKFAVVFSLLLWSGLMMAQRVYHVDVHDGLSSNSLSDLTRDHLGNMWIGSYNGLMKFSGTQVRSITSVGTGPQSLSSLEMHSIWEDKCGDIWVGTTNGLDRVNPTTWSVRHYPIRPQVAGVSSVGYLYAVFGDSEEFIWICTDIGLFKLDPITGSYITIPVRNDQYGIPDYSTGYNGFIDSQEGIWILTGRGMVFYEYHTGLFYHRYYNPDEKAIFNIVHSDYGNQSDMERDADGRIWFVLNHELLASYNPTNERIDTFRFERQEGAWRCCYSVAVDARGNVWVGMRHGGVIIFDVQTSTFRYLKEPGVNRLIQSDYIYSIEKGEGDQMFVAHQNGLDIVDLYDVSLRELTLSGDPGFKDLKYQSGDIAYNPEEDLIYIPFYRYGFLEYHLSSGEFSNNKLETGPLNTPLVFFTERQKYVATQSNLFTFINQNTIVNLGSTPLLPDEISRQIKGQVIWYYRQNQRSVYLKSSAGQIFHWAPDTTEVIEGIGFKPNICVSADSQYLDFLNADMNLIRRDLSGNISDTIDLQRYLKSVGFSFANPRHVVDDGSCIWMTGQNGILKYCYSDTTMATYTVNEGLSHSFNFGIVLDHHNNVWVSNLGGIDTYDAASDRFVTVHSILSGEYMDAFGSAVSIPDGRLVFHLGNKLYVIVPDSILTRFDRNPQMVLNEVLVNGKNIDWTDTWRLQHLHFNENRLAFSYDLLQFREPGNVGFKYRLNSRSWIDNGGRTEVNFDGLASGDYLLEVSSRTKTRGEHQNVLSVAFAISPPFWKTWWFRLAVLLFISLSVLWLIRRNLRRIRAQHVILVQMAELKSTALRAQMNPHFIFNCLNAIQECVVTGKIDEAYTYLSKFSRLLRLVLEHSDLSEISLQQEIETLHLYVSLEKLRFKDSFDFGISVDSDLESESIYIPSMLIQPHLENAIWHGLQHREGDKRLTLVINEETAYLKVTIEDNGIGRTKAAELKALRMGAEHRHTSKGLAICDQRMTLLQKQYQKTRMEIEDLYDNTGPLGTRVSLQLPIISKSL